MTHFELIKQSFYQQVAVTPGSPRPTQAVLSDIVLHLPVLEYYASLCNHVTEFGTRGGCSTAALLAGCKGEVHSYDIEVTPAVRLFENMDLPCKWHFHVGDTGSPQTNVAQTDMLFVDTLHTYEHVIKELTSHGRKAGMFLAFHDTFTCGELDLSGPDPTAKGILPAIEEFLAMYPNEYHTVYRTDCNNGLWVLKRVLPQK